MLLARHGSQQNAMSFMLRRKISLKRRTIDAQQLLQAREAESDVNKANLIFIPLSTQVTSTWGQNIGNDLLGGHASGNEPVYISDSYGKITPHHKGTETLDLRICECQTNSFRLWPVSNR